MSGNTSNLLPNGDSESVQLSNGILVHNHVDLNALGLSSYKKYFHYKELSTEASNSTTESTISAANSQTLDLNPSHVVKAEPYSDKNVLESSVLATLDSGKQNQDLIKFF